MNVDAPPIFGLDIGAATTVCAKDDGELLRNELGGHTTATLVAYLDDQRCLGEAAVPSLSSKPKNTVTHVGRYACLPPDASAALAPHRQFSLADDGGSVELADGRRIPVTAALGALLGKVRRRARRRPAPKSRSRCRRARRPRWTRRRRRRRSRARAPRSSTRRRSAAGRRSRCRRRSRRRGGARAQRPAAPTPADGEAAPPPPRPDHRRRRGERGGGGGVARRQRGRLRADRVGGRLRDRVRVVRRGGVD